MYTAFASVYDRLMADVDYLAWARFYHELMERYGVPRGKVCECACGTGSITIALSKDGLSDDRRGSLARHVVRGITEGAPAPAR